MLGTRKRRSNSDPGSVLKELTAQLNVSSHLQSPKGATGRVWGRLLWAH